MIELRRFYNMSENILMSLSGESEVYVPSS